MRTWNAFYLTAFRFRYLALSLAILPLAYGVFLYGGDQPVLLRADSQLHYLMAAGSATLFLLALLAFLGGGEATIRQLVLIGVFTGTLGLIFLFVVQFLAAQSMQWHVLGTGFEAIVYYLLRIIAYSYGAAEDPFIGFVPSLLGFTFGIGLCEELVKALPILWALKRGVDRWHEACVIGFASGAGFGVAEGILYCADYNGAAPAVIYVIRFVSCVGAHAVWTATAGILLQRAAIFDTGWAYLLRVVWVLLPVMALHGLYNTLLKRDLETFALFTDVGSFVFFAFQLEAARGFSLASLRRLCRSPFKQTRFGEQLLPPLDQEEMAEVNRILERVYLQGTATETETERG